MSTQALIACKQPDGYYKGITCSHDGYLSGVGKTLVDHYNTHEKVNELLALGDLSVLGENIGTQHDFMANDHTQCTAFKRDRGEENCDAHSILWLGYKKYIVTYMYDPETNVWYYLNYKHELLPVCDLLDE